MAILPVQDNSEDRRVALSDPRIDLEHPHRGATILFVEDEPSIREMATLYLAAKGYRVVVASSGDEAVTLWREHAAEIDLVVTDLIMPGRVNGHQLVERLRADRPDLKVIFVSGYSPDTAGEETLPGEATKFLPKPYRLKEMADRIHDCLWAREQEPTGPSRLVRFSTSRSRCSASTALPAAQAQLLKKV